MTKEEHAKVLQALQLASGHVSLSYKQCQEVDEAIAIMRKEPPTGKESLQVQERISDAEILELHKSMVDAWIASEESAGIFWVKFARALLEKASIGAAIGEKAR